jgi:predicted nucleotidyltransferase
MATLQGLAVSEAELEMVSAILLRHVPLREVWAFGSRVKGSAKRFSDLDLVVIGEQPLPLETLASLADDFSESDLHYKVDVIDWATTSPEFRDRIQAAYVVLHRPAL